MLKKTLIAVLIFAVFAGGISLLLAWSGYRGYAKLRASARMAEAASNFIAALSAEQKAKALFDFNDEARHDWEFFPRQRKGLPLKEMNFEQRRLWRTPYCRRE
jgi:hypothetical protein